MKLFNLFVLFVLLASFASAFTPFDYMRSVNEGYGSGGAPLAFIVPPGWVTCYDDSKVKAYDCVPDCGSGKFVDDSTCIHYDVRSDAPETTSDNWCSYVKRDTDGDGVPDTILCGTACKCVDVVSSQNGVCSMDYVPVCAGGKTYSNSCHAKADGFSSWVDGECPSFSPKPCAWVGYECVSGSSVFCQNLRVRSSTECGDGCDSGSGQCIESSVTTTTSPTTTTASTGLSKHGSPEGRYGRFTGFVKVTTGRNYFVGDEVEVKVNFKNPGADSDGKLGNSYFLQASLVRKGGAGLEFYSPLAFKGDKCNNDFQGHYANSWVHVGEGETVELSFKLYPQESGFYEVWVNWIYSDGGDVCDLDSRVIEKSIKWRSSSFPFSDSIFVDRAGRRPQTTRVSSTTLPSSSTVPSSQGGGFCGSRGDGFYCSGNTLVSCVDGVAVSEKSCDVITRSVLVRLDDTDDEHCQPPVDPCTHVTKTYDGECNERVVGGVLSATCDIVGGAVVVKNSTGAQNDSVGGDDPSESDDGSVSITKKCVDECSFDRKCRGDSVLQVCRDWIDDDLPCKIIREYACDAGQLCVAGACPSALADEDVESSGGVEYNSGESYSVRVIDGLNSLSNRQWWHLAAVILVLVVAILGVIGFLLSKKRRGR